MRWSKCLSDDKKICNCFSEIWLSLLHQNCIKSQAVARGRAVARPRPAPISPLLPKIRRSWTWRPLSISKRAAKIQRLKRGDIWTGSGGKNSAGKTGLVVTVREDSFDATDPITICAFTTDLTDSLFRLPVEPNERSGLRAECRMMVDKIATVPKSTVGTRVGRLDDEDILRLNWAVAGVPWTGGFTKGEPGGLQGMPLNVPRRRIGPFGSSAVRAILPVCHGPAPKIESPSRALAAHPPPGQTRFGDLARHPGLR